jgi:hypothetical protein
MNFKDAFPRYPEGIMTTLTEKGMDFERAYHLERLSRCKYAEGYITAINDVTLALLNGVNLNEYVVRRTEEIGKVAAI